MLHKKSIRKIAQFHGWWVYQSFLKRSNHLSEDERQAWIHQRIKKTLIRAADGTRYYGEAFRKIGFDPRTDYTGPESLSRLPILTKDIVRERGPDLIDRRYSRLAAWAETSGTSGQPLRMLLNESYIALDYACMYQMWSQAGYRFRDPFVALRSYVPSKKGEPLWKHDRAQNALFMSAYHFSPRNAAEYLEVIQEFQPKFIRAYPSSLAVLANYLSRTDKQLPSVRGLFTASETLTPVERSDIEAVFGPILFDWYGMTEPTLVAFEGPEHDGLNVVWQYGHAELLGDPSLRDGTHRLLATSLQNPVMPFIRYETGDLVVAHPSDSTVSAYPKRFARIEGRKDDLILTPDGRRLPSVNFYSVFRAAPGIVRFQIVQYGTTDIVINLESTAPDFLLSRGYRELREELSARFGPEMRVEYRINSRFETSRDGKIPVIVRRRANKAVEERNAYTLSSQTAWARHREGQPVLKLDWNEADSPPSSKIGERLSALVADPCSLIWYPEAHPAAVHEALATHHGVQADQVLATHGSDMALSYVVECYVNSGDKVMIVTPSYDNFRAVVEQHGGVMVAFEFGGDGLFPMPDLTHRLAEEMPRLLYLTNPNNPIGYHLATSSLGTLCIAAAKESCLVLVDEAYAEFAPEDAVSLIREHPNLILVRTFSKAFGLAGVRFGYLLADTTLIETVRRVANPKHLTSFAQVAALAALEDWSNIQEHIIAIKDERDRFVRFLEDRSIPFFPSHGNFVLFRVHDPGGLVHWLEDRGIMLRDRSSQISGAVRATIGSSATMNRLTALLDQYWIKQAQLSESSFLRAE